MNRRVMMLAFFGAIIGAAPRAAEKDAAYVELAGRSHPVDLDAVSLENPWGERLKPVGVISADFGRRIVTAAQVYSDQKIRFDGYVGSDDDGMHYGAAADGKDNAYFGDEDSKSYRLSRNKKIDDTTERVWVCLDYPIHTLTLAGFPIREAMIAHFKEASEEYLAHGYFPENHPKDNWFFRRVLNVRRYFMRKQLYVEERITKEQYRDESFRPQAPFRVGDLAFFGHYGDDDGLSPFIGKHSGIVASVDKRGLPLKVFNMRVSVKMYDNYDAVIDHWRTIAEQRVFFKRFSDRYSLVGFGRIVNPYVEPMKPRPWKPAPLSQTIGAVKQPEVSADPKTEALSLPGKDAN